MNDMREVIVHYNARQLGYEGLEGEVMGLFDREPKPRDALYVERERFGTRIGTVLAFYETNDPNGLVRRLLESYGEAISEIEHGTQKRALDEGDDSEIDAELG